jgi:hypothetical protein
MLNVQSRRFSSQLDWGIRSVALGFGGAAALTIVLYAQGWQPSFVQCYFQKTFGFPGPGCGLTRSLVALIQGDWHQALFYHLFGPILLLALLVSLCHWALELSLGRSLNTPFTRIVQTPSFVVVLAVAFLGYYAVRLYVRYSLSPAWLNQSEFWQLIVAGAKAL